MAKTVRIGCAAAFWGDTQTAAAQLVEKGDIDYLVFDYLAEITMSILATQRMRNADTGFARDFVNPVMAPLLGAIKSKAIKVVTNAGGVNPEGCRAALAKAAREAGVDLKIAVVLGDDLMERRREMSADLLHPLYPDTETPGDFLSMNAYLGAPPIAAALAKGADVVITGRCVDSAVVLGPLMHEFGWAADDYDRLAAGSLAGHVIECGTQCTGGNFTDWEQVPGYEDMGFPIAEVAADGSFEISKPPHTGGLVSVGTVAEQTLYEIGDPSAYMLPDVVCDFTDVRIEQAGDERVRVTGARGLPPTGSYKVSATYPAGFRTTALFVIGGIDAARKGCRVADAILTKTRGLLAEQGFEDYLATNVETLGAEAMYGANSRAGDTREVMVKIAVQHNDDKALKLFAREIAQAATGMAPGVTGYFAGRPKPTRVVRLYSALVDKSQVAITVDVDGQRENIAVATGEDFDPTAVPRPQSPANPEIAADAIEVPLIRLAIARSGDKGDDANIGVMARKPEYLPYIRAALTENNVAEYFKHLLDGDVQRFELPGFHALNFLLTRSLGGGGVASLRTDPQGKCYGQMLLDYPVQLPEDVARSLPRPEE